MLSDCSVLANSKETKLGSSNQDASSPEDKNVRLVIKLWCSWKSVHSAVFSVVDIPKVTGCHFFMTATFSLRDWVSLFYDSYILIKGHKKYVKN